jgi:UDP-2,4-diacetamido-2,4,6-trideoxy-beta-L-altropyranose hydrolase
VGSFRRRARHEPSRFSASTSLLLDGPRVSHSVLLRVDAGADIGYGHLMRCVALAEAFDTAGVHPVFLLKYCDNQVMARLLSLAFQFETLSRNGSLTSDCQQTSEVIMKLETDGVIVVTDVSHSIMMQDRARYEAYTRFLGKMAGTVAVIDGLSVGDCLSLHLPVPCRYLVIPYLNADQRDLQLHPGTVPLLGCAYFPLRRELVVASNAPRGATDIQRVVVSMGGADPGDLTGKVLDAFSLLTDLQLDIRVLLSGSEAHHPSPGAERRSANGNHTLCFELMSDAFPKILNWADLALIGSGLTRYETALVGTPSIVLAMFPSHVEMVQEFSRAGAAIDVGLGSQATPESIAAVARLVITDPNMRHHMKSEGQKLVDGQGAERLASILTR